MISPGEIVYCIITAKNKKGKVFTTPPTIFSCPYTGFKPELDMKDQYDQRIIEKAGAKESIIITCIKVISHHGYRNRQTLQTTNSHKGNDTGAIPGI